MNAQTDTIQSISWYRFQVTPSREVHASLMGELMDRGARFVSEQNERFDHIIYVEDVDDNVQKLADELIP
jgi:hypothetical protein